MHAGAMIIRNDMRGRSQNCRGPCTERSTRWVLPCLDVRVGYIMRAPFKLSVQKEWVQPLLTIWLSLGGLNESS